MLQKLKVLGILCSSAMLNLRWTALPMDGGLNFIVGFGKMVLDIGAITFLLRDCMMKMRFLLFLLGGREFNPSFLSYKIFYHDWNITNGE